MAGNSTVRVVMRNVHKALKQASFPFPSEIQVHWADPVHAEIGTSLPPIVPKKIKINMGVIVVPLSHTSRDFGG